MVVTNAILFKYAGVDTMNVIKRNSYYLTTEKYLVFGTYGLKLAYQQHGLDRGSHPS